ncbi:RidA family protein [Luteimonas sp. BDR2-5]|uniref:RidA family protein n=1 Tax=Proluteimonas luteida TaxID=2878685 RepID=UPI0021031D60
MSDAIQTGTAPPPVGSYPHARRVGELLLLSGIGPRDPATGTVPGNVADADGALIAYDIVAQTRAVFANVRAVLEASGARWEDLVDVTVYLTDMAGDFAAYNAVWAEHFPDPATAPCRTTLGVTALPTPIAIELKCIATTGRQPTPLSRAAGEGGTVGNADGGVRATPHAPVPDDGDHLATDAPPSALTCRSRGTPSGPASPFAPASCISSLAPSPAGGGRETSATPTQSARSAGQPETPR